MMKSNPCPSPAKSLLFALCCAVGALAIPSVTIAAETAKDASADHHAAALPVTASVEKGAATESGPYSVKLKNTSHESLAVNVKVLLAVASHAENKAKMLPEQSIKAGESFTVPGLAMGDKVVVSAKGHAPLTVVVK